ncbi:collagen binding domain-containing protein [Lysinibacillus sp. NPDC097287]|uniref:collagen binding domain-containing protein n=1 Tax=Lysinibacillus sp. NPDC097287 TaxID=3364144 RepID=UPI0037F19986
MKKKLNIAILTMLLMFQTVFSPISVFADGVGTGSETDPTNNSTLDNVQAITTTPPTAGVTTTPPTAGVEIPTNIIEIGTVKLYEKAPYDDDGNLIGGNRELKDFKPNVTDTAYIAFEWAVPDTPVYKANDTFTFELPKEFTKGAPRSGELSGGVGTFEVDGNNKVTFTFTEEPNGLEGYFFIGRGFSQGILDGSTKVEIPFDFKGDTVTIPVNFESPLKGMTKSGKADRDMNPTKIDWTIDLNTAEDTINAAKFEDALPAGVVVDIDTIQVEKLNISMNGGKTGSGTFIQPSNTSTTGNVLRFDLGTIKDAYRVTYTTNVTEEFTGTKTFTNTAKLLEGTNQKEIDSDSITVKFNEPLKKKAVSNGYNAVEGTILWEVEYNYNQKNVDGILNDELTGAHTFSEIVSIHKVDINTDGQAVNPIELQKPNDYVNTGAVGQKTFKLDLSKASPNGQAYKIVYKTKLDSRVEGSTTVKNEITMQDDITSGEIGTDVSQVILKKSATVNYKTKEITWTLKVNQDARKMTGFIIKDTFGGQELELVKSSVQGQTGVVKLIDDSSNTASDATDKTTKGFEIHYTSLEKAETITYVTKFDPAKNPKKSYSNKAQIGSWVGNVFTPIDGSEQNIPVTPGDYTKDNGKKTGVYNAQTKEITWTVITNYNLHKVTNAVFKDTFTGDQTFLPGSFKVEKLTLGTGEPVNNDNGATIPGTLVCGDTGTPCTVSHSGNNIEHTLGMIENAHRITYKTSLKGKEVAATYSNLATLLDDNETVIFSEEAIVKPTNGGKYIDKFGIQGKGLKEDLAHWKVTINPSQSYIAGGSKVKDTIEGDQKLLKESFELYEVTDIPSNGTINNGTSIDLPNNSGVKLSAPLTLSDIEGADYRLQVTDDSFKLTFENPIEKPYILVYDSFIMGDIGKTIKNSVSFEGHTATSGQDTSGSSFKISWDEAGGGAVNGKGYLKIKKVDDTTTAPLSGAEFELWNSSGDVFLEKLVTDANGEAVTTKKYKYKTYLVKETKAPEGYTLPADATKKFTKDETTEIGITTIKNKVDSTKTCNFFTFTLRDKNGNVRPLVTVDIKNSAGVVVETVETDKNGQVVLPSTFLAGSYKVFEGKAELGTIDVSFTPGECLDEVSLAPACPDFTITVRDVNGKPEAEKNVIIKDSNKVVVDNTVKTDENGKVTLNDKIKYEQGKDYYVYDKEENLLGKVTVSYVAGLCQADVQPSPPNACSVFTITVRDEDGNVKKDTKVSVEVDVKDTSTGVITTKTLDLTANDEGQVKLPSETVPGSYTVKDTKDPSKILGQVTVSYKDGECQDKIQYPKVCTVFEITVINPDGVTPKANTKVIVKDEAGTETTYTTDTDGEIKLPSTQSPGKVTVYEANPDGSIGEEINEVKVTYTENCKDVAIKNACPNFTLTVNDKDLAPVGENVKVTIKDKTGQVVETGKTDATGKIVFEDKTKLQQGQSYTVFNEAGVKLGEITVSYIDGKCGAAVKVPENSCPIFTLTVQDVNGNSRPNVDVTIKDGKGNTVAITKTDGNGVATVPYTVEPGVYYVYEGNAYINYITVTDTCSATVKPPTGGGGGWTPPPTEPPVNPENPTPGNPDPEKPVNPEDPKPGKPDSEKPVNPEDPKPGKPDSEKPVNPEDPTPDNPDSEKPVNPEDPTPGNPGSENPTNPGNTTTDTPGNSNGGTSVQEIIDQGKKLPPYNATKTPSQDTLDKYKDFLNNYSKLSKEDQLAVGKTVDIDKIKTAAKQMEAQLAKGKLPQTNGADQTGMIAIGLLLVAASVFFLRRRNVETK